MSYPLQVDDEISFHPRHTGCVTNVEPEFFVRRTDRDFSQNNNVMFFGHDNCFLAKVAKILATHIHTHTHTQNRQTYMCKHKHTYKDNNTHTNTYISTIYKHKHI